jgi:hypothetical protein
MLKSGTSEVNGNFGEYLLLCLGVLLGLAGRLRPRLRFRLLLRCPTQAHPFGGCFSLGGAESSPPLFAWRGSCYGQRILGWAPSTLRWSSQSFDGSGEFVSLPNMRARTCSVGIWGILAGRPADGVRLLPNVAVEASFRIGK